MRGVSTQNRWETEELWEFLDATITAKLDFALSTSPNLPNLSKTPSVLVRVWGGSTGETARKSTLVYKHSPFESALQYFLVGLRDESFVD